LKQDSQSRVQDQGQDRYDESGAAMKACAAYFAPSSERRVWLVPRLKFIKPDLALNPALAILFQNSVLLT